MNKQHVVLVQHESDLYFPEDRRRYVAGFLDVGVLYTSNRSGAREYTGASEAIYEMQRYLLNAPHGTPVQNRLGCIQRYSIGIVDSDTGELIGVI